MAFKFHGVDFLGLDSSFSEDELMVRRTARDFVEDKLIPIIEGCFREGRFPRELVPMMGEMGFFGANLEGYGCAGMSNVEYGLVMQELERGDSGVRSFRQRAVGAGDVPDLHLRLGRAKEYINIFTPKTFSVSSITEAMEHIEPWDFPLVIKSSNEYVMKFNTIYVLNKVKII